MSIKHCPQPDPPELVMRADGYHYQSEDEMNYKELTDAQIAEVTRDGGQNYGKYALKLARAAIAADRVLNAPADRDVMREAINALLHQIDIGDFVDSNGHSAKMLKAVHDLTQMLSAPAPPAEQQGEQEPVAYLRAKSSMARWNSFEVCEPNDGNAIPVYTHTAPSLTELRDKVKELPDYRGVSWAVNRNDVLALIDKMGGKV